MNYQKVLVSVEQLDKDEKVLRSALDVANRFHASLTVLHVNTLMAGMPSRAMRPIEHKVSVEELEKLIKANNPNNISFKIDLEVNNNVEKTIIEISKDFDLVVLGHRHMNFLEEMLIDSIDEKVINRIHCDCLVVQKDS